MDVFSKIDKITAANEIDSYAKWLKKEFKEGEPSIEEILAYASDANFNDYLWQNAGRKVIKITSKKLSKEVYDLAKELASKYEISKDRYSNLSQINLSEQTNDTLQRGDNLDIDVIFDPGYDLPIVREKLKQEGKLASFNKDLKVLRKKLKTIGNKYYNQFWDEKAKKQEDIAKKVLKKFKSLK